MNANSIEVEGNNVDGNSRCFHYHSPLDIVAIKFKCCNKYYSCYYCHLENTDHSPQLWHQNEFDSKAVLCGNCKNEITIAEYLSSSNTCPNCKVLFNPRCSNHYHYYFKI